MKNFYKQTLRLAALAAISLATLPAQAQLSDIGVLLQAGKNDANLLAGAYAAPLAKGFGAALNSGWNMGAKTHKFLGFDVSVRVGLAQVPTSDQTYDISSMNLTAFRVRNGSPSVGPTFSGKDLKASELPTLETPELNPLTGEPLASFTMPTGIGQPYSGAPMVQVGVGLIFNTDVAVRYVPATDFQDFGSIELMGASVKHGLNQWIPGGDLLPVDIAVQAGFTNLNTSANLSLKPEDLKNYSTTNTVNEFSASHWDNQKIEFTSSGYTINALVGKDINLLILGIGVYGGIGIESAETTIGTPGNYPVLVPNENFNPIGTGDQLKPTKIRSESNPLDLKFDSANSMRYTVGAKVRFLLVNLMAEYTYANYPILNAGVAISFR